MTIETKVTAVVIAVCAILAGLLLFGTNKSPQVFGSINPIYTSISNKTVYCTSNTSTLVVGTSSQRQFLSISNISTTSAGEAVPTFLSLGVAAAVNTGIALFASTTQQFDQNKLFTGAIYCVGNATGQSLSVSEN